MKPKKRIAEFVRRNESTARMLKVSDGYESSSGLRVGTPYKKYFIALCIT